MRLDQTSMTSSCPISPVAISRILGLSVCTCGGRAVDVTSTGFVDSEVIIVCECVSAEEEEDDDDANIDAPGSTGITALGIAGGVGIEHSSCTRNAGSAV